MKRRLFLTTLISLPILTKAEELNCEEFEFRWTATPEEIKSISLGTTLDKSFKGASHRVTVTRIDQCGDRATIYAKCEY